MMETSLNKLKTAIVGCGMISSIYIKNLKNLFSITDVVALCDYFPEKAQQQAQKYGIDRVMTLEEVLASAEIELVVNLTGPAQHYDVIKAALLAGKHVYTEKMLCTDLEKGKELIALADEKGLYLGVAPDTILGAGLQTARNLIDAGLIGRVTSCIASINRDHRYCTELFNFLRYPGGAFHYDVGVYFVQALLSLLGPVKKVSGFTTAVSDTYEAVNIRKGNYGKSWKLEGGNNVIAGSLFFENGALGSLHFNGENINDVIPLITIYGTKGILYLGDPGSFNGFVRLMLHDAGGKEIEIPFTHGYKGTPLFGGEGWEDSYQHRGLGVAEMAWSIRKGRPNRCSKELGLHTMELLCGLDISSESDAAYHMTTTFTRPAPLPSGYFLTDTEDSEISLAL